MKKRFTRAGLSAAILVISAAPAWADEPQMSPLKPAEPVSMQGWGEQNPACAEWTNACAICKRNEAGVPACSTIGIACQPKAISCSRQAEKSDAKKP